MGALLPVFTGLLVPLTLVMVALVQRQRRLLIADPQRRRFFVQHMGLRGPVQFATSHPASTTPARVQATDRAEPVVTHTPRPSLPLRDEGVVYFDAAGRCTFANQAARSMLHWSGGELALSDVLAGGRQESTVLLDSLARQGLVEQHTTALAGVSSEPVEISAVAFRDRDDNLWGAALFIQPPQPASSAAAAHSPSTPPPH